MGRKLDLLLGRTSRQMQELKSLLSLAVSRLAVLRHRRQVLCDQARGDVAQLLQLGHVDRALLRVEHVINHQNMLDVFAMLEHYCHLLAERAVLLDHKQCPEELREAIASLIFAASRCGELPEMGKIRGIFSSKYGREFVSAAVELRNDCGVNPKMIQKLSTRPPSLEVRQRVTKEIAAEKGIKLDFCDPTEGDSIGNSTMDALDEQLRSEETTPARIHAHQKYKDVAGAAQAAFESAALAAAAARAAVELCRSESHGKGSDDESKDGSQQGSEIKESKMTETSLTNKNLDKEIHHDQNHGSDSEEGIKAKQIYSSSESSDDEDMMNSSERPSAGFRGKKVLFDESEDGSPGKHRSSYLHRPYGRGDEARYGEKSKISFDQEMNKPGLRSGAIGINSATYDNAENTYLDSVDKMQLPHLSSEKKPISVRTRRGHRLQNIKGWNVDE